MFALAYPRGTLGFLVNYILYLGDHSLSCYYEVIFHHYYHYAGTKLGLTVSFRVMNFTASLLCLSIDCIHVILLIERSNFSFEKTAVSIFIIEHSLAWSDLWRYDFLITHIIANWSSIFLLVGNTNQCVLLFWLENKLRVHADDGP